MHRIALTWGPLTLYSYGLMLVVAFVVATILARAAAARGPRELVVLTPPQILDAFCMVMLAGIVGGRLFFVIQHWEVFIQYPLEIPAIWHGGLVWYGGFVGGVLGMAWYVRRRGIALVRAIDQVIPFVALGHGLGRIGCFLNGCCYGIFTSTWIGVTFPGHDHPVIPTQLLEAAGLIVFFLVLRRVQTPEHLARPGRVLGVYMIGYGVLRFILEYLRGDQSIAWAGLTLAQLMSVAAIVVGAIFIGRTASRAAAR